MKNKEFGEEYKKLINKTMNQYNEFLKGFVNDLIKILPPIPKDEVLCIK